MTKPAELSESEIVEMRRIIDSLDGHAIRCGFTPWYHQHNGVIQRRKSADLKVRKDGQDYWMEADFLDQTARLMVKWREKHPKPEPEPPLTFNPDTVSSDSSLATRQRIKD